MKPAAPISTYVVLTLLVTLILPFPLNGAVDMFIKIGDIKGESNDDAHKDEIDVLSWSWGMANNGTTQSGGGGAGKVSFQDLSCTKYLDKATPKLMEACSTGTHLPEATLVVRKAGEIPIEYLIIRMENVLVSSVSTGGSGGEDRLTENVSLNFSKVHVEYTEQKPDGSTGGKVEMSWNVATNTP